MSDEERIRQLHEKIKKLSTVEMCDLLVMTVSIKGRPQMIRIIKTYIARSIAAEGIE